MEIILKTDVNINNNPFFNDLYKLMNNKEFQKFYKKYLNNWDNINRDAEFPPGMSSAVKNYILRHVN